MADDLGAHVSLLDLANETHERGFIDVAKILTHKLPVFGDAHMSEGNMLAADKFGRDAELAQGEVRDINDGIDATKGSTDQITERITLYQSRNVIDEEIVRLSPSPLEFRYRKDNSHVRGNANDLGDKFLYDKQSVAHPNYIDGFQPRYNTLSLENVYDNGDASGGAVTSAYIFGWGAEKVSFLYPRNGKTQIVERKDMGLQLITGKNSKQLWAWVTEFYFRYGLKIMDNRYVQRIANIGTSTANHIDIDLLIEARNNLPDTEGAVMYVNAKVYTQMCIEAKNKGEHLLRWIKIDGKPDVLAFQEMPIRKWDSIKNTEAVVT